MQDFIWILDGLTGFDTVLLGFSMVLLGFPMTWLGFRWLCGVLLSFTEFYWPLPVVTMSRRASHHRRSQIGRAFGAGGGGGAI